MMFLQSNSSNLSIQLASGRIRLAQHTRRCFQRVKHKIEHMLVQCWSMGVDAAMIIDMMAPTRIYETKTDFTTLNPKPKTLGVAIHFRVLGRVSI